MFQPGEYVLYGLHGVCRILCYEMHDSRENATEYYVLEPVDQVGTRYYIPIHKAAADQLRAIMTPEELVGIIRSSTCDDPWIDNINLRKQHYRQILCSGNRADLIKMMQIVCARREQLQAARRRLPQCDEGFLKDAKRILDAEFALVFGLPSDQVVTYIQNDVPDNQEFLL